MRRMRCGCAASRQSKQQKGDLCCTSVTLTLARSWSQSEATPAGYWHRGGIRNFCTRYTLWDLSDDAISSHSGGFTVRYVVNISEHRIFCANFGSYDSWKCMNHETLRTKKCFQIKASKIFLWTCGLFRNFSIQPPTMNCAAWWLRCLTRFKNVFRYSQLIERLPYLFVVVEATKSWNMLPKVSALETCLRLDL